MTAPAPDSRAFLEAAIAQFDLLVRYTSGGSAAAETPCPDYTVADLVAHVAIVIGRLANTITHDDVAGTADEANADWHDRRVAVRAAMLTAEPTDMVSMPFGALPLHAAYGVVFGEITTHSWDLAAALDRRDLLDPGLGEAALSQVIARIPERGRSNLPFHSIVDVPTSAGPYDRLAGWMGRDPAWRSRNEIAI